MLNSLLALALTSVAHAWTADEPWRTVETDHYRIHYPLDSEAWALDLAGRIDAMRDRVAPVVGWQPEKRTEVIVMDPWGQANGFAVPFARMPLMGVFPTAPGAGSGIGNYRLWAEDLVVHEDAHLLHLGRPSRNAFEKIFYDGILGVPAIATKSPAWVIEGYATLVEGILTGAGRPNSDGRATFLRTLAREGQLPSYDELDGSPRWRGRSMRYLVGSAYLEWLAHNHGDQALPDLWARMTAKELRTFDDAFEGVFGDSARDLYGRFVAELTAGALSVERTDDKTRFIDLQGEVGAPASSPDGKKVAVVRSQESGPSQLVVYGVAVDAEAQEEREEELAKMLEKDPLDVRPVDTGLQPHEELWVRTHGGRGAKDVRWIDDGTLLFSSWVPDGRGNHQPDLFTWAPESGKERRLTRQANLREAEPCGDFAIAVHRIHGGSGLVRVSLEDGSTTPLTDPAPGIVEGNPRMDSACQTVAWLRNDGEWRVIVASPDDLKGTERQLILPTGGQPLSLDVRPDGKSVVVALGTEGWFDLWERPLPDGDWVRRTAGVGGVFDPDASTDGSIFYLAQTAQGFDLHHLPADAPLPETPALAASPFARGAVRPPPVEDAPAVPEGTAPSPKPYGLGKQYMRLATGSSVSFGNNRNLQYNIGFTMGDLVGRSQLLVLAGVGSEPTGDKFTGARAAWTVRQFALHPTLEAWALDDGTNALKPGGGASLRLQRMFGGGGIVLTAGGAADGDLGALGSGWMELNQVLWMGPTALFLHLDSAGRVGPDVIGQATANVSFGQRAWRLGVEAERAGALEGEVPVGLLEPGIQPRLRTAGSVWWPQIPDATASSAASRARAEARFASGILGVWVERAELAECAPGCLSAFPEGDQSWTVAALDVIADTGAQPIGKVPGLRATIGVACTLAAPGSELSVQQCDDAASWTAWLGVRLEPARPPAYP